MVRYIAVCQNKDCGWKRTEYSYIVRSTAENFAEIHMMQTGHIVNIQEVV